MTRNSNSNKNKTRAAAITKIYMYTSFYNYDCVVLRGSLLSSEGLGDPFNVIEFIGSPQVLKGNNGSGLTSYKRAIKHWSVWLLKRLFTSVNLSKPEPPFVNENANANF